MAEKVDLGIEFMYQAGKELIPDKADALAALAKKASQHIQEFNVQTSLAGDPPMMTNLLKVGGDIYDALCVGVKSLNAAATAVIATADDFVKHDDDARRDFEKMDARLDGISLKETPQPGPTEVPPDIGEPEDEGATPTGPREGGHPSQPGSGSTPTPEPEKPEVDAGEREENEQESETENPPKPEEG